MFEDVKRRQLIKDLKNLVEKAEAVESDTDIYCEFMKELILNSYSAN